MSGKDRMAIFPSRANFVLMKQRIASAQKGLSLLKRKRDALEMHLRQITAELKINRDQVDDIMKEALFSLTKARFLGTDFKPATVAASDRADAYVRVKYNKIVGIQVPTLELIMRPSTALNFTGLSSGGHQVKIVREKFQKTLKILVAVASLKYSVKIIEEAVKQNNKRVNGLEYVVLPRYQNTANYISDELDEFEREDFYRLKRSQAKQLKKKSAFIKEIRQREHEKDATDPGYDFIDTHLQTPVYEVIAGKPEDDHLPERRKTVVKAMDHKIIFETEEAKPLNLDATFSKAVLRRPTVRKSKKPQYVASSSSEEEEKEEKKAKDKKKVTKF